MAYGQFTAYEPVPDLPGAYSFRTAGGKALTFGGPEAEQLRARLDAANAATRTSGIDSIGGYGSENEPPSPEQIQAFRQQFSGAAPASPEASAPPPAPAPGGQLGYGLRVSPQGTIQKFAPGTRGVSAEDIRRGEESAVAVRRGETDVVQQGTPVDPEYLDARAEQNIESRLQNQQEQDAAVAAAEAESALAQRQFEQSQRLAAEEAARQQDLQRRFAQEEVAYSKALNDYTSQKPKDSRNPVSKVLGALAAAGGAYASTIAKTPNFALDIINQSISRDIAAQEAEIRLKGEKANNLLSQLRQRGLSIDQSRAALKAIHVQNAAAETAALKAKAAVPAIQAGYEKLDLAMQRALLEANEQSRLAAQDKVTRQTAKGFERPRAGSAGGWVDVGDQLGTAQRVQNLQKGEVEIAKDRAAAEKGPTASPEKRQAMSAIADAANLEKSLKGYKDDEIAPVTEQRSLPGRLAEGAIDVLGGKGAGARATLSERDRRMAQDFANAQQNLTALQSVLGGQGALSGAERDAALAGLAPGATMGEVKRAVAMLRQRAEIKLEAAEATGEAGGNLVTR